MCTAQRQAFASREVLHGCMNVACCPPVLGAFVGPEDRSGGNVQEALDAEALSASPEMRSVQTAPAGNQLAAQNKHIDWDVS